jgi:hypothetical protein
MGYLKKVLRQRQKLKTQTESFRKQFYNCAFWHWDIPPEVHQKAYDNTKGKCCFNHAVGLPWKNNEQHPIYAWQKELFDALQSHKLLAILKARNVGASEFLLRYIFWNCVKDDKWKGKNVAIITGIREDLSLELLRRFRNIMPNFEWNTREAIAEINECRVIGYPSKRVKDLRGLTDVAFIMCDEFAFFDETDQRQLLPILEAFQAKSNPTICLLSTPGRLNDEFHNLFLQPADKCRYHRLYIPLQKAIGTLISEREAQKVKNQKNYLQEFELRFGAYDEVGSIFNIADVDFAVKLGEQYANPSYNPKASQRKYPYIERDAEIYALGIDPGGWGHSKFGICLVGLFDSKIHVLVAEEHDKVDEDAMIRRILSLRQKTPYPEQTKVFIDAANVAFIQRLKGTMPGERVDYQEYMEDLRKRKLIRPPDESEAVHYMDVVPISFSKQGPKMLANLYAFLQRGDIAMHPRFTTLISALQSARNVPNRNSQFILDKSSQSLDCLDALRLALFNFDAGAPDFEEEEGEVEDDNNNEPEREIMI